MKRLSPYSGLVTKIEVNSCNVINRCFRNLFLQEFIGLLNSPAPHLSICFLLVLLTFKQLSSRVVQKSS